MHSIEWAAGLFEGEGSMSNKPRLELSMTDFDVVEKFRDVVGFGFLKERTQSGLGSKPLLRWRLYKKDHVRYVLGKMLPFFGNRRAYKALNILDDLELA